jgi:hypothetical protein
MELDDLVPVSMLIYCFFIVFLIYIDDTMKLPTHMRKQTIKIYIVLFVVLLVLIIMGYVL